MTKLIPLILAAVLAFAATGCAVTTKPLTDVERTERMSSDLERLFVNQEPVTSAIDLAEAMARAIKYNLDHRVKLMEMAVAKNQVGVAKTDLLPQITASAGYTDRNNESGASSQSLLTGEQSLEASTSQERERTLRDLTVVWNTLDFGVSYYTARQRSDEILIAEERRRKVIQNIMQDVIDAFWRALGAQTLLPEMDKLIEDTEAAVDKSKRLVETGSRDRRQALEFQRALMEIRNQLWEMRERLALAKTRLATLINLRPGSDLQVMVSTGMTLPGELKISMEHMEQLALTSRPELREEDYRKRISQWDVKKAVARMLPGFEINTGDHYDSNKFLFNDDWRDIGLRISWNLFNVFGGWEAKKLGEAQVELADTRRLALSMAVMTQVRLSAQRYALSRNRYAAAADLAMVNHELLSLSSRASETQTVFDVIRARAATAAARMREHLAFAETQNAMGRVFNSVGVDPLPDEVADQDIKTLSEAIEDHWSQITQTFVHRRPDISMCLDISLESPCVRSLDDELQDLIESYVFLH